MLIKMSRLIVKNLPKSATTEKLREIFSEKGVVTDVQLKYTKDGKFRRFGFVGFKTEEAAQNAVDYFNNSCINASRITVELSAGLGDPKKPKAWSKYAPDSSAYQKIHKTVAPEEENEKLKKEKKKKEKKQKDSHVQELVEKHKDDPMFLEFMESHTKGNKAIWSNDTLAPEEKKTEDSDDDEIEEEEKEKEDEVSSHPSPDLADSSDESSEDEEEEKNNKVAAKKEVSDLEYMKMKTVKEDKMTSAPADETGIKKEEKKPKVKKELKKFFTVKLRGLSYGAKKKDVKQFLNPLKPKSIRVPVKMKGIAYVGFETEKEMNRALMKHKGFYGGRRIWVLKYTEQASPCYDTNEVEDSRWKEQEEILKSEETIAESGRIFIRNLTYTVTEDIIEQHFSQYGPLAEVNMPIDRFSRKPKGFATVTYVMPEHAMKAYTELDGSTFHGRLLHLLPGKAKKSPEELLEMEGLPYKQKKALQMKAQAASSHNWNSLFLGQNAVADLIADTYNTTKEKVLDVRGSESLAVRLALGETQIVSKTQEFLLQNGVSLDAFNQAPKQRSKTVILAKNLPAKTTSEEMQQLFMKFGEMGRVVLPPSGVTAIIEFLEPSEARAAFTKLAYTKFKHLPLYLEWAPADTFSTAYTGKKKQQGKDDAEDTQEVRDDTVIDNNEASSEEDEEDEPPEPDTTLFIKNLNFNSKEEGIREHFKKCGPIHSVSIARKKDPKNPGQFLSMGYGFIQFKKKAGLEKALKTLQQSVLEGLSLELKRSNRTLQTDVATARKTVKVGKQTGSKILVRNVPFQATKQEVESLFKTFGELKAMRLPRKMVGTGQHRGFAFVEYYTKHDAKRAFKTLSPSTHLYGRRLVLEWASTDENIDELRKRTADRFMQDTSHRTLKRSTVDLDLEDK